ncbi:MAG: hypothetical protein AB7K52_02910 [Phycisphaerales bacterium]
MLITVGTLIAAVVVLTAVVLLVRRRFLSSRADPSSQAGLMEELRRMKLAGLMSDEEFNRIRSRLASKIQAESARKQDTPAATRTSPGRTKSN